MRHPDCYARLHNLWHKKHETPFQWGRHDCLTLALEAVEAVTGERLYSSPNPLPYHSYESAQGLLKKQPLLQRVEGALKKFDVVQHDALLQSGDLAIVSVSSSTRQVRQFFSPHDSEEEWVALGVLDLCASGFVLPRIPKGLRRIEKKHLTILKAWRIA